MAASVAAGGLLVSTARTLRAAHEKIKGRNRDRRHEFTTGH
jgi:hypothetical protein